MAEIRNIRMSEDCGCYNFCDPQQKGWSMALRWTADGVPMCLSHVFDEEQGFSLDPESWVEHLWAAEDKCWINTGREKARAAREFFWRNYHAFYSAWLTQQINQTEARIERDTKELKQLQNELSDCADGTDPPAHAPEDALATTEGTGEGR